MSRARNLAVREAGYAIVSCDICKFDLCRSDGTEEYSEKNWLRTCEGCSERCCRDCLPVRDTRCKTCRAREAERLVGLEVARAADNEIEAKEEAEAADDKY